MRSGLEELTVVITGASGGIGWATAEAFAAEGAQLVLHANTGGADLEQRVGAASWADRALVFAGDLREEDANEALFAAACERFGRADVAILNAGIWPPEPRPLWEMPAARLRATVWQQRKIAAMVAAPVTLGPWRRARGSVVTRVVGTVGAPPTLPRMLDRGPE